MESLNWNAASDPGLCTYNAPYRSVDSEFILRYTSINHWYDGPPDGSLLGGHGLVPNPESLAFYPRQGLTRKDLPLFPHLPFPSGADEWDARKGLREKLRLQSARSALEPLRPLPLRPQVTLSAEQEGVSSHLSSASVASRQLSSVRVSCPVEIKQEVLRRLQLRRQNSSPNLALQSPSPSPKALKTSYTTDNIASNKSERASEQHRAPIVRLYIPTFEEFKQMRQKEGEQNQGSTAGSVPSPSSKTGPQLGCNSRSEQRNTSEGEVEGDASERTGSSDEGRTRCHTSTSSTHSPIRTGPSPRSPLEPVASLAQQRAPAAVGDDGNSRRRRSSLETVGSVPFPTSRGSGERPSSCCPALLLEGTDLSSYGAKIYKMKDGLIGSALDLIMKRLVWAGGDVFVCEKRTQSVGVYVVRPLSRRGGALTSVSKLCS